MDLKLLHKENDFEWHILPEGKMQVPAIIYASKDLVKDMDMKVYEQLCNVTKLPGIVQAAYAMPCALGIWFSCGRCSRF